MGHRIRRPRQFRRPGEAPTGWPPPCRSGWRCVDQLQEEPLEGIDQHPLLKLRLGLARSVQIPGEVEELLVRDPPTNPVSIRAEFHRLLGMGSRYSSSDLSAFDCLLRGMKGRK